MTGPRRILILDNTYTFGGAINSLGNMLQALDRERFEPVLVTGQPREFLENHFDCRWYHYRPKLFWVDDRIYRKIAAIPGFRSGPSRKLLDRLRFLYWFFFIIIPESLRYYLLGRRHRVSLVHLNNIIGSQLAGILAAKLLGVPCVAHMRDFEEAGPISRYFAGLVDHYVAISGTIRENLLRLGVPGERITIVHDAIRPEEFDPVVDCSPLLKEFSLHPSVPRFGFFGRVVDWKGVREFIQAARIIADEVPGAKGFIVGGHSDGDEGFVGEMHRLAEELGLKDVLVFTGYRSDVPALMKLMDVVVHASNSPEPFGMVIIEAMAMEKPVVATRAGGPLDIVVEGETGYLVEIGNSSAMGKAVVEILRNPEKGAQMGRNGRQRAMDTFTAGRCAVGMEGIYRKLLPENAC